MPILPQSFDNHNPRQVLRDLWRTYSALKGIDEAKKSGRKSVLLLVDRAGDLRFVALRIDQG